MRGMLGVVAAGLLTGCAPALSSLKPATVAPKKHVDGAVGYGLSTPTAGLITAISTGKDAVEKARNGDPLTPEDRDAIIEAGLGLSLNPPSVGQQYQLAYGLADGWEVDLRYALSAFRLGTRYQAWKPKAPGAFGGTIGFGVSRYVLKLPVPGYFKPVLDLDEFERWDFDVPVSFGVSHEIIHLWFGPKLVASIFDARVKVCTELDTTNYECTEEAGASLNGRALYLAGQAGIALGYRYAWVAIEMTMAHVTVQTAGRVTDGTTSENRKYGFKDFILYPIVGIVIRI